MMANSQSLESLMSESEATEFSELSYKSTDEILSELNSKYPKRYEQFYKDHRDWRGGEAKFILDTEQDLVIMLVPGTNEWVDRLSWFSKGLPQYRAGEPTYLAVYQKAISENRDIISVSHSLGVTIGERLYIDYAIEGYGQNGTSIPHIEIYSQLEYNSRSQYLEDIRKKRIFAYNPDMPQYISLSKDGDPLSGADRPLATKYLYELSAEGNSIAQRKKKNIYTSPYELSAHDAGPSSGIFVSSVPDFNTYQSLFPQKLSLLENVGIPKESTINRVTLVLGGSSIGTVSTPGNGFIGEAKVNFGVADVDINQENNSYKSNGFLLSSAARIGQELSNRWQGFSTNDRSPDILSTNSRQDGSPSRNDSLLTSEQIERTKAETASSIIDIQIMYKYQGCYYDLKGGSWNLDEEEYSGYNFIKSKDFIEIYDE